MCTVEQLIAVCEEAIRLKVKYIYGAKWQKLTLEQIKALRNAYGSGCVWISDNAKAGNICCDCSGLISKATGIIRGSSQFKSTALECYPISKRTAKMRGWAVWMKGHIGIYDGNDGYYAMDGSARNAVHYPLSANNFTHIIKLKDVDYDAKTAAVVTTPVQENIKNLVDCQYRIRTLNRGWTNPVGEGKEANNANDAITDIAIAVSKGTVKYRVHVLGGKWLPWVSGYNIKDYNNGYAGNGKVIDAVQIKYNANGQKAKYQVGTVNKSFWPIQCEVEKTKGQDGYAGVYKTPIVKFKLEITDK